MSEGTLLLLKERDSCKTEENLILIINEGNSRPSGGKLKDFYHREIKTLIIEEQRLLLERNKDSYHRGTKRLLLERNKY